MIFSCSHKNIFSCISVVQKTVTTKTTMPILEGILIETIEDKIKITGRDMDTMIQSSFKADIIESGSVVIPCRLFVDLIRSLPDDTINISSDDNFLVNIKCNTSSTDIQGFNPDEYPSIEQFDVNFNIELNSVSFSNMIKQSVFCVATDETRPVLTGALVEFNSGSLNMVCLDGYRLALIKYLKDNLGDVSSIIPGKTLNELSRILSSDIDENLILSISERYICFNLGKTKVTSRLLEGDFIDYNQIIPEEHDTRIKVDRYLLQSAIDRASLLSKESKNNLIKMSISEETLVITSNSDRGKSHEEVPVLVTGKDIEIAFNAKYFVDILKAIEDDEICIDFTTDVSPCIIRPLEGDRFAYLLLPVRIHG